MRGQRLGTSFRCKPPLRGDCDQPAQNWAAAPLSGVAPAPAAPERTIRGWIATERLSSRKVIDAKFIHWQLPLYRQGADGWRRMVYDHRPFHGSPSGVGCIARPRKIEGPFVATLESFARHSSKALLVDEDTGAGVGSGGGGETKNRLLLGALAVE